MYPISFVHHGRSVYQPPTMLAALAQFATAVQPARVIEIGTKEGGLTGLLAETFPDAAIVTYDVASYAEWLPDDEPVGAWYRVTTRQADVFAVEAEIAGLIGGPGQTVLFCDGGHKIQEFQTFAPYLKMGDVVLAHDYPAEGWSWIEITDADIAATVEACGLVRFHQDVMGPAAWVSYRRMSA